MAGTEQAGADTLAKQLDLVRFEYKRALTYQASDPQTALMKARYLAEAICKQIYRLEGLEKGAKPADRMMLNDLIGAFKKHSVLDGMLLLNIEIIQRVGNFGAHDQGLATGNLTADDIKPCMEALGRLITWYFTQYHEESLELAEVGEARRKRAREMYAERFQEFLVNDGRIDEEEAKTLRVIAEAFGLEESEVPAIEAEVRSRMEVDATLKLHGESTRTIQTDAPAAIQAPPSYQWAVRPDPTTASGSVNLQLSGAQGRRVLAVLSGNTAVFGRNPPDPTGRVILEPIAPVEQYGENLAQSKRISSSHMAIDVADAHVRVRDLGSTGGTQVDSGPNLAANLQVPLRHGQQITLAGAIALRLVVPTATASGLPWVRLDRVNNTTEKSYLVLTDQVWLKPSAASLVSEQPTSVALRWIDSHPALCNAGDVPWVLGGVSVGSGQAVPLHRGFHLQLPDGTTVAVS